MEFRRLKLLKHLFAINIFCLRLFVLQKWFGAPHQMKNEEPFTAVWRSPPLTQRLVYFSDTTTSVVTGLVHTDIFRQTPGLLLKGLPIRLVPTRGKIYWHILTCKALPLLLNSEVFGLRDMGSYAPTMVRKVIYS